MSNKPKILIVDDTPLNLMVLQKSLQPDYDITVTSSGSKALALIESEIFDLVLLDIVMPEMDGFTVLRMIRQIPHAAEIPVIFVTGLQDPYSELMGLELGAIDFTFKPIKTELVKLRIRNILHLASIQNRLKVSEGRLEFMLDATNEGVWDWLLEEDLITHNMAWSRALGLPVSNRSHSGAFFTDLIHPDDLESVKASREACLQENIPYKLEYRVRHSSGGYVWILDRGHVAERGIDGKPTRLAGIIANIQERKELDAEIHRLAFYDPLTELPNRRLLLDRLSKAMIRSKRNREHGALMFLDMDRFKLLNDTHGHQMGDLLLIQVARRISECLRAEDTVARIGGDEFIVLIEGLSGGGEVAMANARQVAEKILFTLNQPYNLISLNYSSTPSIGLTLYNADTPSIDAVLASADRAMYEAKSRGRNQVCESSGEGVAG